MYTCLKHMCICMHVFKTINVHRIPLKGFSLMYVNVIWEENPIKYPEFCSCASNKKNVIQDVSKNR